VIAVARAPAYLTIQDMGRHGYRSAGVPRGGAMDRWSLAAVNQIVGNARGAAGLEWALSGGALQFRDNTTFAFGGADAVCALSGVSVDPYRAISAKAGDTLVVDRIIGGRFLYVAVSRGIACEPVLGSRSTYLAGGFGGHDGRRLRSGDLIATGAVRRSMRRHQVSDPLPAHLQPSLRTDAMRIVLKLFGSGDPVHDFMFARYNVSPASDRTGYRLDGTMQTGGESVTSEPVCPGAIQLPPDGGPIVLMADAPTIGGYRVAGCVVSADLGSLAQKVPGDEVTFEAVSVRVAQAHLQKREELMNAIAEWAL